MTNAPTVAANFLINAVSVIADQAFGNDTFFPNDADFFFGWDNQPIGKLHGDVADVQMWFGTYVDFSIIANVRNFLSATGKPVNPTIAAAAYGSPTILFTGDATTFGTNQGSGGPFTTHGVLTTATTHP